MIVTPIAHTVTYQMPDSVLGTEFAQRVANGHRAIDALHEFAGRACYQSWDMPNPKTATNEGYMANIISQAHFSVLEHGSVTFYIEGVSRALTHELIRHRHLSYSELSQRYVDVGEAEFVKPPAFSALTDVAEEVNLASCVDDMHDYAEAFYNYAVATLTQAGLSRKRAREAARAFMPNMTETKIVVTGNLRAWRDMLQKRWHVAADAEIRELAGEILSHLRHLAPHSVADIPLEPYE